MPLLRRQNFERLKPPPNIKPEHEVFYCRMTNEIFRDYEEFFERIILCNSLVWSCSITGRSGMTFQEAIECEERARKHLATFPNYLERPILYLASLTHRSRLVDLNDDVFVYAKDRFFKGETVDVLHGSTRNVCKIMKVVIPNMQQLLNGSTADSSESDGSDVEEIDCKTGSPKKVLNVKPSKVQYVVLEEGKTSTIIVKGDQIVRRKGVYTRDKSKLYLKQHCEPDQGLWQVKVLPDEKLSIEKSFTQFKVILLPKMTIKEHFFVSRLVVFNETFASVKEDGDFVILWHEAISGRLGVDVASTYVKCVNLCEKDIVIFWADNCTGQNKNWALYTVLCWWINQNWGPQSITMKYFERGHTFMRTDSVHGSIRRKMNKGPEICTFQDFVDVCDKSGCKIKPITMQYHDFDEFEDGHRNRNSKNITLPLLNSISVAEFRKGSRAMWFKLGFEGDYPEVLFLKPKFRLDVTPTTKNQPRGIPGAKRQNILKLADSFTAAAKNKF